jgi:PPOX class probable FMN-dependent enzyme
MGVSNPHRIETLEQLRAIIPEPGKVTPLKIWKSIEPPARDFIARSPFLVLSTSDDEGRQDVSPKGDPAGFVLVEDEHTLLIPDRKGNKLAFGLQNILRNPHVGVLFVIPGTGETLRVNGTAEITTDPAVLERLPARGQPAVLAIRVRVEECFFHCAKAFIRSSLWKPEAWGDSYRVSFGKMMAPKLGGDENLADLIDSMIEQDYRDGL